MKPNHADSTGPMAEPRFASLNSVGLTGAFLPNEHRDSGVDGCRSGEDSSLTGPMTFWPDDLVVQRVDRILARHYRLQPADRQDVIAEALLVCFRARGLVRTNINGFFVVVARRRACDFWRHKSHEDALAGKAIPSAPGSDRHGMMLLEEIVETSLAEHPALKRRRAQKVVREVLEGASFTEACRASGIPRGSQGRYRSMLQQCLRDVLHRGRRLECLMDDVESFSKVPSLPPE